MRSGDVEGLLLIAGQRRHVADFGHHAVEVFPAPALGAIGDGVAFAPRSDLGGQREVHQ